ncbi:nucleotidyltransferase family protein [Acidipropionibacterium jensenii]
MDRFAIDDPTMVKSTIRGWVDALVEARLLRVSSGQVVSRESACTSSAIDADDLPVGETLTNHEWGLMAHGLAHGIAASLGIRAFSIKGPVLEHYGLRPPRASADADIWIDPVHYGAFTAALTSLGWIKRFDRGERQARVIPWHSFSYYHPEWPIDIDVHWWFPGIGIDREEAFNQIWENCQATTFSGVRARIPSKVDAAVIQMLHCVKDRESAVRRAELVHVVSLVGKWSTDDRACLVSHLVALRACDPLRPVLMEEGVELPAQWTPAEQRRWDVGVQCKEGSSTLAILYELEHVSWRSKPGVVMNALWPSDADVILTESTPDVSRAGMSRSEILVARARRLVRGVKELPEALHVLLRAHN